MRASPGTRPAVGLLANVTLASKSVWPGGTWKKYVFDWAGAPARPLPPVSTPLKVPPLGPMGTTVRTVTGTVVWPSFDEITTDWSVSPAAAGVVRLSVAVAVLARGDGQVRRRY